MREQALKIAGNLDDPNEKLNRLREYLAKAIEAA